MQPLRIAARVAYYDLLSLTLHDAADYGQGLAKVEECLYHTCQAAGTSI